MRGSLQRRGQGAAAAGFTLLELLVALLISMMALLIAGRLLLEAQSRMAHAARRARDPLGETAREQLRTDLRAAAGVRVPLTPGWSRDALVLREHPAGGLRYEKVGGELIRDLGAGRRVVLRAVTTFRWRLRGRSVEIDLGFRETPRLGLRTAGGVREGPIPAEDRRLFRVTPRGAGGRRW